MTTLSVFLAGVAVGGFVGLMVGAVLTSEYRL